jgi:hypothetical protein
MECAQPAARDKVFKVLSARKGERDRATATFQ